MFHDFDDIVRVMGEVLKDHNIKIVDCGKYDTKSFKVPKKRQVSHKWIVNAIKKRLAQEVKR